MYLGHTHPLFFLLIPPAFTFPPNFMCFILKNKQTNNPPKNPVHFVLPLCMNVRSSTVRTVFPRENGLPHS